GLRKNRSGSRPGMGSGPGSSRAGEGAPARGAKAEFDGERGVGTDDDDGSSRSTTTDGSGGRGRSPGGSSPAQIPVRARPASPARIQDLSRSGSGIRQAPTPRQFNSFSSQRPPLRRLAAPRDSRKDS